MADPVTDETIEIAIPQCDGGAMTRAVIQVADMLGLYRAEVARLLGLRCEAIGAIFEHRQPIDPDGPCWQRAQALLAFYQRLRQHFHADPVAMYHWLRAPHPQLGHSPLRQMVDEGSTAAAIRLISE